MAQAQETPATSDPAPVSPAQHQSVHQHQHALVPQHQHNHALGHVHQHTAPHVRAPLGQPGLGQTGFSGGMILMTLITGIAIGYALKSSRE